MERRILGVNKYDNEVIMVKDDEPMSFSCEHCGKMKEMVYFNNGVNWCELCFNTLEDSKFLDE